MDGIHNQQLYEVVRVLDDEIVAGFSSESADFLSAVSEASVERGLFGHHGGRGSSPALGYRSLPTHSEYPILVLRGRRI